MKKILFAILILILPIGCARLPYISKAASINYSQYYEAGFFITESNSVSFDYEPVANMIVEIRSGYEVLGKDNQGYTLYGKKYIKADVYDALDKIQSECEALGANGIINFSIEIKMSLESKDISSVVAAGMAIKR